MPLLNEEVKQKVREQLADVENPVRLVMFTQEFECQFCAETRQLVEEVAGLSDHIEAEIYDFVEDKELAETHGIDKIPVVAVLTEEDDYGIRFYGIPSGYEFTSLLEAIRRVSNGDAGLTDETHRFLSQLNDAIHLQVFVTPTCPYCPQAVVLAHQMALASSMVRADMVEAQEFPHLSTKYQVMGVPRTVINETTFVEGAAPESMVLQKLQESIANEEA